MASVCPSAEHCLTFSANMPDCKDTIAMNKVHISNVGTGGLDVVWDFSDAQPYEEGYRYFHVSDSAGIIHKYGNRRIISLSDCLDTLKIVHEESRVEQVDYSEPRLQLWYPLCYGDSASSSFSGSGRYCGSHFVRKSGTVSIEADGAGMLVLPSRDTLDNVLRVHILTATALSTELDSDHIDTTGVRQEIESRYEWYASGYRYPILTHIARTSYYDLDFVAASTEAYLWRQDLSSLTPDTVNEEILRQQTSAVSADVFHYELSCLGDRLSVSYTADEDISICALLCSATGIIYQQKNLSCAAGESGDFSMNLAGLQSGNYVLYMNVNGKAYSEKIHH